MSPIVDTAFHIRAGSDGTIDASTTCVVSAEIGGTGMNGLALMVVVPISTIGCVPTLTITVHASTTSAAATTDPLIATRTILESTKIEEYIIPFYTEKRSVCFAFDVTGGSSPTFSQVDAWIVQNVGLDWKRTNETF